jgi:hypothetical protein
MDAVYGIHASYWVSTVWWGDSSTPSTPRVSAMPGSRLRLG